MRMLYQVDWGAGAGAALDDSPLSQSERPPSVAASRRTWAPSTHFLEQLGETGRQHGAARTSGCSGYQGLALAHQQLPPPGREVCGWRRPPVSTGGIPLGGGW